MAKKDLTRRLNKDSLGNTIKKLEAEIASNKRRVKRPTSLSQITSNAGILEYGEFRVGNGSAPGSGFTGVRMLYPGATYGGEDYNIIGVNDDVLQWGGRVSDGVFVAGAGAVEIDANGISILSGIADVNSLKWVSLTGNNIYIENTNIIIADTTVSHTETVNPAPNPRDDSVSNYWWSNGNDPSESVNLQVAVQDTPFFIYNLTWDLKSILFANPSGIIFNADGEDRDFQVKSDTDTHMIFGRGSDGWVGIGEAAPLAKLDVAGEIRSNTELLSRNLIKNYPSIENADGTEPMWWETTLLTLTEEGAAGEGLAAPPNERVLKGVTTAAGGYFQQGFVPANERRLSASNTTVSAQARVYLTTAGTLTLSLVDSVGGTLGTVSTTTTGSWVTLEILAETIGANTLYWKVSHSVNAATFHVANPLLNTGGVPVPFASRGLIPRDGNANIIGPVDPGGGTWTDADASGSTTPNTAMLDLRAVYQNSTTAGKNISLRTKGLTNTVIIVTGSNTTTFTRSTLTLICDEGQIVQYDSNAVVGDTESLFIALAGLYWEWE